MRYGMSYMGSKNKIAKWVIENLPKKENLYDLFGGGGAITHCALEYVKFERVYYNELDPITFKGFDMAIHGKFKHENRWISREEFNASKDKDPYVAICFSFGNDLKSYCYSKRLEAYKKACHYAVCFNDFSEGKKLGLDLSFIKGKTLNERRRSLDNELPNYYPELKMLFKFPKRNCDNKVLLNLVALNRLQSLERLESLQHLQHLDLTNKDYADVQIKESSVIYCDPPYSNTKGYKIKFDSESFYNWCRKQKELVIISEYNMPEDFICVAQREKISLMCSSNRTTKTEKLFVPKHQYQMYLDAMAVLK